jgi:hypothetical protein
MTSQLVAFATQSRKPSEVPELEELEEEDPGPGHIPISASRQLALSRELELELDDEDPPADEEEDGKQVPHLAMMLSTAFSHFVFKVQPAVTAK